MNETMRTELHLHTKLSDDISVIDPREAMYYAIANNFKAIAFTSLNSVQDFPEVLKNYKRTEVFGIKVIYGAELRYMNENEETPFGVTVLVKNQDGIKDLYKIISSIHNDGVYNLVDLDILNKYRKNLLIGSCGDMGELYKAIAFGKDAEKIATLYDYFELYPTEDENERAIYKKTFDLGEKLGVPVVASGNCHYSNESDEIYRHIVCTVKGHKDDNKRLFIHTTEEMLDEFSYLGANAVTAVIEAPNQIAELIEQVTPLKEDIYPPIMTGAYEQVHELAYIKAKEIYGETLPQQIAERLETELQYIKNEDFATYYLTAYYMVKHINELGYPVGTRGAVGSVLVAFLLGITDTNPMPAHYYCLNCSYSDFDVVETDGFDLPSKICPVCGNKLKSDGHNIPFEFFMGCDGSKMPDIDLNFPVSKQHEVFEFLQELFGANRIANAGTILTSWDNFAKDCITDYESKTDDYLTTEQRESACYILRGFKRQEGRHPGGVFVIPEGMEFEDFTPLRDDKTNSLISKTTHFNSYDLCDTIVKIDVLCYLVLDMLKMLEELTGKTIDDVVWNDEKIYSLFRSADTYGIAEFDKDFMKKLLHTIKPKSFDDLVRISGIAHGTGTWIDNGEELFRVGHIISDIPSLRDDVFLLLESYGVDRETAFEIAEYVRKGKLKIDTEMTKKYIRLMQEAKVPEWYIKSLGKIFYMFPKAHSVAYVMNAVRLAWFKVYYPTEFDKAYSACYCNSDELTNE